jgi:hypothetical protein
VVGLLLGRWRDHNQWRGVMRVDLVTLSPTERDANNNLTVEFIERRRVAVAPLRFQWHRSVISPAALQALHPPEWSPCLA